MAEAASFSNKEPVAEDDFTIYLFRQRDLEQLLVALKRPLPRRSVYDIKELPAITAAAAYSGLDDESAEQAYNSIRRWMEAGGYRLAGPKREIYLDNLLEIQFPFQPV